MESFIEIVYNNMYTFIVLFWAVVLLFSLLFLTGEREIEGEGDSIDDMSKPERVKNYLINNTIKYEKFKQQQFKFFVLEKIKEKKRT